MEPNIIVQERYLKEILSEIGFPLIGYTDLKEFADNLNDIKEEDIKSNIANLVIFPAMREFYKWFPLSYIVEYFSEGSFDIDFPDPYIFTVLDARLNTSGFGTRDVTNPFVNNSVYRSMNTSSVYGGRMYGTNYDYDMKQARLYDRMERQSLIDMNAAFRIDVDEQNRNIRGYCNVMGKLVVTWGKYSENFSDIPLARIDEVIKLAKSNLLSFLGKIRGQQQSNLPNAFNYTLFLDNAETYRKEVLDKWKSMTKVVLLRR